MSVGGVMSGQQPYRNGGLRTGQQGTGNAGLRTPILIFSTMTTGLTAGVFADWSSAIMPGLSDVDDRTFVEAFQGLDAAIANPLFLGLGFTGALLSIGLSAALHLNAEHRKVLIWIGAALVGYLLVWVITLGVHEPLNVKLRDAGRLESDDDFAAARAQLDESMWTAWNTVRALAATIAFGCLTWALVIHRRLGQTTVRRAAR
jgi:uncharacterized membrane protein